ncbi:MAG: glycoside hydrolase family 65 protein, partial [Gammaproteobacteria bacterium]|nr:glycoside hydrolase family 65 protein [Gammaproteobacteria bacterium]NIR94877.1 glycoside hydrolase family 65 protein [Gammaproteobacteria bacterium]
DGCHIASMGGTWMVAVYGFAGMRDYDGEITFDPRLPVYLDELSFHLRIRGQRLKVHITQSKATYLLEDGVELKISHQGKACLLKEGAEKSFKNKKSKRSRSAQN